jgi:hypothetical protein
MTGKGIPHRHLCRKVGRLSDRNVNEVCLYFKELRIYSATRPTLNANIAVKALPEGAKTIGAGAKRDETGAENDEPTLKLDFDPKAKRKPGQVLKLTTTFAELTSPKGAKFGWVDPVGPKTREEAWESIRKSQEEISSRPGIFLQKYKKDTDGNLTVEIEQGVRIKELGRSIGSTVGRVATQAFQAAGGVIDGNGKLRCPPGTPNANQFTDVDMTNCGTITAGSVVRSLFRIGKRMDATAAYGAEVRKYGRALTPYEREQQNRFEATRGSIVLGRDATAAAAAAFNKSVDDLLSKHGVTADQASSSSNADLIMGLRGLFREQFGDDALADARLQEFLFGKSDAEKLDESAATLGGGIFADAGLGGEEFIWEGDMSDESIAANTKRYDEMMKKTIAEKYLPTNLKQMLESNDPREREIAEKSVQAIRERHHQAQREFLMSQIYLQEKYPDAYERVESVRALMPYDLTSDEKFHETEGSTKPIFNGDGDIQIPTSFNALGMALRPFLEENANFKISDDGSIFIDAPGAASEAQRRELLLSALEEINDAILYAEIVADGGFANQTSEARLQAALGIDPIRGQARHVAFHEFGHVLQYHAVQQKIIEAYEKDGVFVANTPEGLVEFKEPPSTWTNRQWVEAVSGLMRRTENAYKFPPGGATRFEKSFVNLFAGAYYQNELEKAEAKSRNPNYTAEDVDEALKIALIEGSAEIFAQRELGILGGPEVDDSIAWQLPENIGTKKVRDIVHTVPPEYVDEPPTTDSPPTPDIPTNTGPPTDSPPGAGGTVINVTIHAPINIVINNNYGADEPGDAPALPDGPKPKQVDVGWNDLAGHIYFDNETQWQPGSTHNLPIEQNPDEISRFVDVAFGLGPEEGGPDPNDPLGEIRQTKDAYWKMAPEQMDARYEKLESEYKKLVEKSRTEPLTADEQARMWLAIKGMRQVLDVNTRKSKLSDEEIEKYKARGINPRPGKYMRRPDSALNRRKDLRTGPIEKRKSRGYDDIVEVDDDELAHWSREIADHVGDAIGGKDGFDASSREYTPGSVRNTPGMTSKEKRKLNPNYKPTQEEVDSATLVSDPALVGRRKMDEMSADLTPEQKDIVESDDPVEMSKAWTTVGDAVGGDVESLRSAIDTSARARQRIRDGAGTMSKPDSKSQDELLESQLRDTIIPTLDVLERSTTDADMSFVAAMELDDDLTPGTKIDHGGPIRGLLIDGQSADSLKFADPSTAKRVMVTMPAGSRAMHTKNGHDSDTDGILIPPGTLEVMKVDTDGTVVLMPSRQKNKSEVLNDLFKSIDAVDAEQGSPADAEKRALKRLLDAEMSNTEVPKRQTRGASDDASTRLLQTNRSAAIGTAFSESGSSFFGTESTNMNGSSLAQPVDNGNRIGRMEIASQTRNAKAAEMTKLFGELEKVRDGSTESEEYWNLFNEISEQTKQLIFSSTAEELTKTVEEAVFKYHEGFDDRPRIAITPEQLTGLLGDGVLRNIFDEKPGSLAASLQKSFEGNNGLSDATPDNLRSHFGYLVHATSKKEIQDYLDSLPSEGFVRDAIFFSEGPEFSQHSEFKAGGKTVELIMVPETARRTAYTRGDIMDGGRQATPMLSTDRAEVLAAHVSGPNSGNSENDNMRETIAILDNVASGTYTAFGTPSTSTRSSRSSSSGPSAEAVVGGGIRKSDIEAIKVSALELYSYKIDADEVGGRDRLKNVLRQSLVDGDLDEILDALLSGDKDKVPKEAQHLITPFNRMRLVLAARKAQADYNVRDGEPVIIFANPDGFDITDIDKLTNLPHIDPNSSVTEKLFQRLRYDAHGASTRIFSPKATVRDEDGNPRSVYTPESLRRRYEYYTNGRLTALSQDSDTTSTTGTTGTPDGGSGQPIDAKPVNPKIVDLINAEVEKGRTTGASELSRVGKGQRTQIDTRRSKLIEKITYDDSTNELVVTWKGNESGRGTERYTGFPPELIRVLEETFKDDSDGSSDPILISEAVNHIANVARTSERMPNESAHAAALSEADKARLRSEGLRSISRTTRSSTASDIESRVSRSISDPDSISTRSTSSSREVRGTSGNRSTTPPAKRKVADVYRDVSELGSPDNDGGLHQLSDEELFEKFGVERSGNMALVDGQELFVANDIETAAALIAAGYHVELGPDAPSPTLLVQASAKLQKEIDAFLKSEKKDPTAVIDTCRLYAGGTNLWCEGGLGTMRADMPQIAGRMRGEDTPAAQAAKAGAVKVDWKGGKRDADGNLTKLTSEEQTRFDELKAKHAKLNKDGTVSPHTFEEGEMEEFYSMVDWNDTEANLTEEFKDYVKRLSAKTNPDKNPDEVIYDESGIDPESLAVSQGQIQMSKTGGMVTSMKNHDSSFKAYMADAHPDIEYGSDEYYDMRDRWLYGQPKPDGGAFAVPLIDENGQKLNSDGDPIGEGGTQGIISQPWFTNGSIISTSDGYVVDGHHRWASFIAYNHGQDERAKLKLKSVVIDAPIQDALAIGKAYQEHWGIKAAKLGKEEMFERVDGAGSMDMDAKKAHIDKLFVEDADGIPLAQQKAREIYKDLYEQKEGFGFVGKVAGRPSEQENLPPVAGRQTVPNTNLSTRSSSTRSRSGSPTRTRKGAGIAGRIIGSQRAQNLLERMGMSEDDADATQFVGELATGFAVGGPPGLAAIFGRRVSRDIADVGLREAVKRGWLSPDQAARVERQLLDRVAPEGLPDRLTDAIAKGTQIATSETTREKARELASTAKQFVGENERIQKARESLSDVGDSIRQRFSRREKIGPMAASTRSSTRSSSGDVSSSANAVPSTEAQKTWKKLHDLESNKKGAINDMTDSELAELGISRSSRDGIIDGKPVYVAETQESAVALMSLGYNVELGDGARARKVNRAVAQLQKEIDAYLDQRTDMSPEERANYKIDSCRMYIANTNIFCGKNIGTARMNMPQISGRMKGDDTVAARAAKAGLVKTTWEARGDLTPEQRSVFDKLKARHPNPDNKFPEGESPLTDEEKKEFYSLVDWKDTEVDFVPKFMDHLRRVSGRDDIVKTRNKVNTSEFTASQGQIQAEKVSGMLAGIDAAHDGFVQWAESRGAKRGSKEYLDLREQWLDGKFDGQIPILDENGQQVVKKGKPQFADPWWAKGTIITSKDGYVVDGHHRWAAVDAFNLTLGENEPPLTINTQELDIGIFDALNLAKSYQTEIGIKEAKLGLEDPYATKEGIPAMSADEFGQFDADTDANVGNNYEKVRDSGYYLPNGPYLKTTGRNPSGGFVGRERPRTTRDIFSTARNEIASTRSSRQPRAFSDDYPSMASIGIDPRPSSGPDGEFEDDGNRALAEGILNGATKAQQKEMEQIAADAVASVQKQQDEIRAQIVRELGSEEDLDDLLTFDRPTPASWSAMSSEKRAAITEMLDRVSQIKESTFSETRDRLVEMAETRRRIRNANITAAKRVARPALPSTRSARTAPSTGTRFASDIAKGIGQQIDGEKLTRDLAGAFKKGGVAGVLSELRKTLRNDSSGWAIGYALEEGYISKAQASFLRKLAARLFKKPPSKRGAKSLNAGQELVFADLLSPPLVIHKETSWL